MVFDNFKFGANFESNILNKTSILHNDTLLVIPQYECNQEKKAIIVNNINNFDNNTYNITSVSYIPFYENDDSSEYFLLNTSSESNLTFINSDLTKERRIILPNIYLINSYDLYTNDPIINDINTETITEFGIDLESLIYLSTTPIVDISIGSTHTLFLDNLGKVYSYGNKEYDQFGTTPNFGQLGRISDSVEDYIKPMKITQNIGDSKIVAISVGSYHSLFLDEDGKVYSCGDGSVGKLGHGNTNHCNLPTLIDELAGLNITHISAGYAHSLFLDEDGKVYSCGGHIYGQLGRTGNTSIPLQITDNIGNSNIVAISTGGFYSLFLDNNCNVYSCGYGDDGNLGHGNQIRYNLPTKIDALNGSNIVAISGGGFHSLFLDNNCNVYSCGLAEFGELGHGNTNYCNLPTLIDGLNGSNITHISAGYKFSLFVEDSNIINRCGFDTKLVQQLESPRLPHRIGNRNNIVNISANKNDLVTVYNSGGYVINASADYELLSVYNGNNYSYHYKYFIFKDTTEPVELTFLQDTICDILIVGGGGGGGGQDGGGGGAGGLIYKTGIELNGTYKIFVGTGGNGGVGLNHGIKGNNSKIEDNDGNILYDAIGGGGGAVKWIEVAQPNEQVGSSGGLGNNDEIRNAYNIHTDEQGNPGGNGRDSTSGGGGGGGGAGGPGANSSSGNGGTGGIGREIDITGENVYYAGGGSGGGSKNIMPWSITIAGPDGGGGNGNGYGNGGAGTNYLGGGGGGGGGRDKEGGKGGSGVVIIRYYEKPTTQFLYTSSIIYKYLDEPLPSTQNSIVTEPNNRTVWNEEIALIKYIDGFIINPSIYLIHKSGKIITKLDTSYDFDESFNIDPSINIEDDNDVISINVNNYIYVIIAYCNKIIKFDTTDTNKLISIEIEDYYYTKKKFSKAIYSYIDNKIYLIPYNVPQLGVIDIDHNTFNFISLTYNDINIFELENISRLFSSGIQYNQYIYMIPESSQYIYVYDILDIKVINVFDISIYNENNYDKSYTFNSAFLSDLGTKFKNIVLVPYSNFNIGIIAYDLSDDNDNVDVAPNFNVISPNIFKEPNDNSEYYLLDNVDIDVGSGEIYKTDYKRGTTNFNLSNKNSNIILQLKSNFPNINFTNHHIIEYKFPDISDTQGIFNLSNITTPSSTNWNHSDILKLEDFTNKKEYLNNSFSANKLSIAFTVDTLPEILSEFFKYSNSEDVNSGIVLKANRSKIDIKIQSNDIRSINCSPTDEFALIIDNSNITLYSNNNLVDNTKKIDSNLNISNFDIFEFGSENFDGRITNFNIFNIDLNDNEIRHLYNNNNEYIADLFLRNENESLFNDIYQLEDITDSKYIQKYPTINFQEDFITSNQINEQFINNIYSIESNIVYFIPYNHTYILELNLYTSIIRQIDISSTDNNLSSLLYIFIYDNTIPKFNNSIILHNKLYLLPYSKNTDFLPLIIYNFDYDDTAKPYLNVNIINISENVGAKSSDLFCVFLYYYSVRNKYLLLIKNKSSYSFSFNINEEDKNVTQIVDTNQYSYIDGYIDNDNNIVYLLESTGRYILKYSITESDNTLRFNYSGEVKELRDNGRQHTKRFSKMLFHGNSLYLIPYTEYRICKYNIDDNTFKYIDITGITVSSYDTKLFNGGAILNYNDKTYIIMIPFNHTALCIYDIDDDYFIFINDPIFETNQFIGCCVDLKGNIYMNTYKGDVLYYSLSLVRQYNFSSIPVVFKTTGTTETRGTVGTTEPINTREISFKNLYKKFHKNYTYDNYNFNNTQIKFSDYYNNGGAEYFTNKPLDINKFVTNASGTIHNACNITDDLSYKEFITLQSEQCNEINLQPFSNITKNRCEYYTASQNDYKINAVDILSTKLYYSSTDDNNTVTLSSIDTITNLPNFVLNISNIPTNIETDKTINVPVPDSINTGNTEDDNAYISLKDHHSNVNAGISAITTTEINTLYINIYSNISDFDFDLSNLIITNILTYLSVINIVFDATYVGTLNINNGIDILMNNVSNKYLRSLNNINITIKDNVFFDSNAGSNKLIQIRSNKRVSHIQTITILEDYKTTEVYLDILNYHTIVADNKKINKLTINIDTNTNSDNTTKIDLTYFNNLHYLKDIIVIITDSSINLTIIGNLTQKCNIIIFSNINDASSSLFITDDIADYPDPVFYQRPSLLERVLQEELLEIPIPLIVAVTLLIYKFEYNANVESPVAPIFNLKYDGKIPFFNQYNVDFNGTDTFLKNNRLNFTIKRISFWFYLKSTTQNNFLLSLYNDNDDKYLTVMISNLDLVIKTNFFVGDDIIIQSSPVIYNWYYIENLFDHVPLIDYNQYKSLATDLGAITLNIGNLQASSGIKNNIDISESPNFTSQCKIGYLKLYKEDILYENNFSKYLDFIESPVYQANFIQYKFKSSIKPEENKYNEFTLPKFITNSASDDYVVNNYFINFNSNISLPTPTTEINVSCLSIWFMLKKVDEFNDNYLLVYKNTDPFKSLVFRLKNDTLDQNTRNLHIGSINLLHRPIKISGTSPPWPPKRSGHTMVTMNDKIYIFGGNDRDILEGVVEGAVLDDFYEITLNPPTSKQINDNFDTDTDTETLPTARSGHTMVTMNDKIYIFGGDERQQFWVGREGGGFHLSETRNVFDDFYEINLNPHTSTRINDNFDTENSLPTARSGHTMVTMNDKIYIFGGETSDSRTDDFYEITLNPHTSTPHTSTRINDNFNVEIVEPAPSIVFTLPTARNGHTMVVLNDKIYIFGGETSDSRTDDFYEITLNPPTSTRINDKFDTDTDTETLPTARIGHTMVTMNNKIYIFGGYGVNSDGLESYLNDFYEIDIANSTSKLINEVNYDATLLLESFEHTMVVLNDKIYIFGGYGISSYFNDFYEIEISTPFQATISLLLFATTDIKWFNLVLTKNNADKYDIYIDNVFESTLFNNTSNYYELEFNSNEISVIQNVKTADLRLYNELLIDSNLLSGIYYDNEILKCNSIRYRFGDNNDENNNSYYKLLESASSEVIYNEYYVSFEKNGYLQLVNPYDTELLSISFYLNTINDNIIYHLISLSNIENSKLEFFIKDSKLSNIVYNTGQDTDLTIDAQLIDTVISDSTWYNLMLEKSKVNPQNIKIYVDNASIDPYNPYNSYSFNLKSLHIGNNNNVINFRSKLINANFSAGSFSLPSKRIDHTMVTMNNKIYIFGGKILVIGGVAASIYSDDFYEIDIDKSTSRRINVDFSVDYSLPTGRYGHTMVTMNNKIYIFGGITYNASYSDDFYEIDIDKSTSRLINLDFISGSLPSSRVDHTMVTMDNKIYIFGGFGVTSSSYIYTYLDDFYEIDIENSISTRINDNFNSENSLPSSRRDHTMVTMHNKIYIFGGVTSSTYNYLDDFYEIDIENSTSRQINDNFNSENSLPSRSRDHIMVALNNKIYIFGGYGGQANQQEVFDVLYEIDITTSTSRQINNTNFYGSLPSPRYGHTMVALSNNIYIFGGRPNWDHSSTYIDDFYEIKTKYDQFDGKIADLQLYNSDAYLNTSIDRNGIYSNLLYYKP
jgi:N-acetylneuraminic acid mutarotase